MCFEERKKAASCVSGCSFLALISGAIMIYFAFSFKNNEVFQHDISESAEGVRDMGFTFILLFSVLAVILAFAGVSVIWVKSRCANIVLSICLSSTWLVILIFGIVFTAASKVAIEYGDEICRAVDESKAQLNNEENKLKSQEAELSESQQKVYDNLKWLNQDSIDTYMCSKFCPCVAFDASADYTALSKEEALEKNRKPIVEGDDPLAWVIGGSITEVGAASSRSVVAEDGVYEKEFDSFKACIDEGATREMTTENEAFVQACKDFQTKEKAPLISLYEWLEDEFECSGACNTNLFFATLPVSKGIPTQTCMKPLAETFDETFTGVGLAGIICGLLLFCTFFWSYCLWKSYD